MADGTPFCPSPLLLVLPNLATIPSRPGNDVSNTAMVLSVRNPVPYIFRPSGLNSTTVGPSISSTPLYGRYEARMWDVYASMRWIGMEWPRHVTYSEVSGDEDVMGGYHE